MKRFVSGFSAVFIGVGMLVPVFSNVIPVNAESERGSYAAMVYDTEKFDAKEFFVYVGTHGDGLPQFRYLYPKSDGSYNADKVIWENAPADIVYGDIFVANGEINMTKVYPAADNPVYAHAYHYTIDENAVLNKSGNCTDIMEKKNLTVTSKTYDGSSHWSIRYKDDADTEYYYGLSVLGSELEVDPLDCEVGDVCTFALYNGNMVIPLPGQNIEENLVMTMGDVNSDNKFNIADAVFLQKWLLGDPDTRLPNWKAADFCKDDKLDVFDLCLMKRDLLKITSSSYSIDTFGLTPTKSGVDEFMAQYSVPQSMYENDELYNITPQEITDKYGFRIFKFSNNCESFLEYNDNIYTLGTGFGGYGTTSFAVADLNNDGNIEIYYTFSWGSGMHRSHIRYFDTALSKEFGFDYTCWDKDMILTVNSGRLEAYVANIKGKPVLKHYP